MAKRKTPRRVDKAKFITWVEATHELGELVNDLKVYTWQTRRECAVIELRGGLRAMVSGGTHGIAFDVRSGALVDPFGNPVEYASIEISGQPFPIDRLTCHTHPPPPTGPSDDDFRMLEIQRQNESIIFEINGDPKGTRFRRKSPSRG